MNGFVTAFLLTYEAIAIAWLCTRRGRRWLRNMLSTMRDLYVITPLRLITGRRAPDHAKIRQMERDLLSAPATRPELSRHDVALLRSGAIVAEHGSITLPSGVTITGREWRRYVAELG